MALTVTTAQPDQTLNFMNEQATVNSTGAVTSTAPITSSTADSSGSLSNVQTGTSAPAAPAPTLANGQPAGSAQTGVTAPAVDYSKLVNANGTIYNSSTGQGYATPDQLAKDLGTNASGIQWGKIAADPNYLQKQALAKAQASGQAPQDSAAGSAGVAANSPTSTDMSSKFASIDQQLSQDPGYQQLLKDQTEYNNVANQQQSLSQTYSDISAKLGIPALDTQLMNTKAIIDGTEGDIRKEVQAAGGFATDSQVMALSSARNKQLILNYNNLIQTKANAENTLNTMVGLASQDRAFALQNITQKMQIDQQISAYRDKFVSAAKEAYANVINAVGYGGLLATLHSDPTAIAGAEKALGLAPGGLQALVTEQQNQKNLAALQAVGGVSTPFVNVNGEFQNAKTGQAYSTPDEFFKAAGVSSFAEAEKKGLVSPMPVSLDTQMKRAQLAQEQALTYKTLHPTTSTGSGSRTTTPSGQSVTNDVQAILEGRNTMYNIRQTMGRTNPAAAYMQQVRDQITKIDPNFDFVASDAGGKSVSSSYVQRATAAINSVLPNIDTIIGLSNQVPRIGVSGVDKLLQAGNVQINNQAVSNFHEAQKLIADEIGVALGAGTVSDMKLQLGFDVTDPSVSQEVFASNMGIVKEFIQNRLAGLQSLRYTSSTVSPQSAGSGDYQSYLDAIK